MSVADVSGSGVLASALGALANPLADAFTAFMYKPWPGVLFKRDNWEGFLYGFGVTLALITAGLTVVEILMRRAGARPAEKTVTRICMALTVLGTLTYFGFFNPNTRYVNYYHRHEYFHYYLGSKYSEELGYARIYECAAIAEVQLGHKKDIQDAEIRDLSAQNLIKPIKDTYILDDPAQCTDHFTEERWDDFKQDLKWFRGSASGNYWVNMKKDHGYNPPPVWTMAGKLFSSFGPASDTLFKWLSGLDILLHVGVLAMFRWAFGWRVTALAAVFWGCNTAANFYWTGGAFLRQDWGFLFVSSLCLAKKRRFALSGAAFIWSGLLRIFPLAAGFGWGAMIVLYWLKHRRFHPDHVRFMSGAMISLAVLGGTSIAVTGLDAYKEFAAHISLHKNTPLTNHMGFESIVVHDWDGRMRFTRDDSMDDAFEGWKQGRIDRKAAAKPLFYLTWAALMAWIVWAVHRSGQFWIGLPLSVPLVMSMTNLTCYYYVIFLAFAALYRLRPAIGTALVATAAASQLILKHFYWIDDRYVAMSYLYFVMALTSLFAMSRMPSKAGIMALWDSLKGKAAPPVESSTPAKG